MIKKIAFLCPKAYPLFNKNNGEIFGGSEAAVYSLGVELAKSGLEVSFIVADYGQPALEEYGGIKVYKSFKFSDSPFRKISLFFGAMKKIGADVYIQRALSPFSWGIAVLSRLLSKKFVYMLASDYEVDDRYEKINGKLKKFFSRLVFKYADKVIAQNKAQSGLLDEMGIRKVFILKSGIEVIDEPKVYDGPVLWVGRSVPTKNGDIFLDMAEKNPEINFVMVSSGDKNNNIFHADLVKRAAEIPNLDFVEYVPHSMMDEYYKRSRVFVSTSDLEGFPYVFLEAAKWKTPIVSLYSNPDGVIEKNKLGFYCRGDALLMAERVRNIVYNDDLYEDLGLNAFNYVKNNHNIKDISRQFVSILEVK